MRKVIVVGLVVAVLVFLALFMRVAPYIGSTGGGHSGSPYSYTGAPPSGSSPTGLPRLHSLDGRLYCMDAGWMTNDVWARMRDYNASDPAVKPYIEWLRNALAPDPGKALNVPWYPRYRYWWFNDRRGWKVPVPDTDSLVRIGLVRLPFGAGLVVTAYQSRDGLTIVVHGTIINETGWRELLARVGAFMGGLGAGPKNVTVQWVLWRIMVGADEYIGLRRGDSYLGTGEAMLPIKHVIVLLEMPAYYVDGRYWEEVEQSYWDVVGEPALAMAVRLAYTGDTSPLQLYKWLARGITIDTVLTGVYHPGNKAPAYVHYTPFLIRMSGWGVCNDQSESTSMFATNALAGYTGVVGVDTSLAPHALTVMLYTGGPIDADGDGKPESEVIIDTAGLPASNINHQIRTGEGVVWYEPPLLYSDFWLYGYMDNGVYCMKCMYRYMHNYFYSGVVYAVLDLPGWLRAPWLSYTMEKSNFTWIERSAWANMTAYSVRLERLPAMRRVVGKAFGSQLYVEPPGTALALRRVLGNLPLIYGAGAPRLKPVVFVSGAVEVTGNGTSFRGAGTVGGDNVTVTIQYKPRGYVEYNVTVYINGERAYWRRVYDFLPRWLHLYFYHEGKAYNLTILVKGEIGAGSGGEEEPLPPAMVNAVVNATWDGHEYRGNTTVDGTLIVVLVWRSSTGRWVVDVWVGEDCAYSGPLGWSLRNEFTVWFTWKGTSYKVTVHIAKTGGGGSSTRAGTSINAAVVLRPVYANISSPWGPVPVVRYLRGTSIVNATNVTVLAWPANGWGEYSVAVYVNGSRAHTCSSSLPATIEFRHGGAEYRVAVEPPRPPLLNQTIGLELEPERTARVPLANGTLVNITIYRVNQTIRIGNTTIHVEGHVSRVSVDLIISVYGVPPANYTAITKGLNATAETTYPGALIIMIHYMVPTNSNGIPTQLIPEGTALETIIQQLSLTIQVRVEG